jgi:hypothetical protein
MFARKRVTAQAVRDWRTGHDSNGLKVGDNGQATRLVGPPRWSRTTDIEPGSVDLFEHPVSAGEELITLETTQRFQRDHVQVHQQSWFVLRTAHGANPLPRQPEASSLAWAPQWLATGSYPIKRKFAQIGAALRKDLT